MNELQWIPIVSDIYSTTNYYQDQNESFEHLFTVDFEDDRPIKLVRIDIQDRLYLKQFSLIYLETGETIEGTEVGDEFIYRFVWAPKKGEYKIISQGGKYRYSVFMLESTMKLTREPICRAQSPFNILVSCPIEDKSMHKQVLYRKVGTSDWEAAQKSLGKVPIEVDPTSAYELKMKLVMADVFETEYSPIITMTCHQEYPDSCNPDPDFLQTTLLFELKSIVRPSNFAIVLRYKPELASENCWIDDAKNPIEKTNLRDPQHLTWDIGRNLYDLSLADDSMTINWQLIFRNTMTDQVTQSTVKKFYLQKRRRVIRGERIQQHIVEFICGALVRLGKQLFLCRDGQFWCRHRQQKVVAFRSDFNGNFTLERKHPEDTKRVITLIPKFKKLENNTQIDQLSMTLLPELVKLILSFVFGPSNTEKLKHIVSLNLVCKHWFNIFADGMLQLKGELMDDFYTKKYRCGIASLHFREWGKFIFLSDRYTL